MKNIKLTELIQGGLNELGVKYSKIQIQAFTQYLNELKKWNRAYNLTSLKTDKDIIIKHFFDSLLYLKGLPEVKIKVADIGSGAGFPGIPLKIMRPEIQISLVDPSRKKAAFLRHIIKTLNLEGISVIEKRIEDIGENQFDVALTRALFSIKDFIKKGFPVIKDNGILILSKGPKVHEEIKQIKGMVYKRLTLPLPFSDIKREIIIVTKTEN